MIQKLEVYDMADDKNTNAKPVIETMINTAAIALTGAGTAAVIAGKYSGLLLIAVGMGMEFFKYWGRKNKYW